MPAATLAREGFNELLAALLGGGVFTVRLYTNDPTISVDSVAANFVEPVFDGYIYASVRKWTPPTLRAGKSFSVGDPVYFEFAGGVPPLPIRGYFVTSEVGGPLLWAWRAPDPAFQFSLSDPLLEVLVTLTFPG
ncbi:MAG TPA: hypothetical protein VH092_38350 [Urbifossiella sp.]|nr:hypothetical protein [Urbifossiella sp.]